MSGRWPAECGMPTAAKLTNVEITQARNLGVEFLAVRQRRTDSYPWHGDQADRRVDWREVNLPPSALVTRYTRLPSTLVEPSFSFRRLRTTPARKPRTECCCQPVAFIMAAIVAPAGERSIAMTRPCFEPASDFLAFGSPAAAGCVGVAAGTDKAASDRFFAGLGIEILHSVCGVTPHHRSPTSAIAPAGQDLGAPSAPGIVDSTAPIRADCQSFLEAPVHSLSDI